MDTGFIKQYLTGRKIIPKQQWLLNKVSPHNHDNWILNLAEEHGEFFVVVVIISTSFGPLKG